MRPALGRGCGVVSSTQSGVYVNTLVPSPSQQLNQTRQASSDGARFQKSSVPVAIVAAATGAINPAAKANRKTSGPRSNARCPRDRRIVSAAARMYSSVLPVEEVRHWRRIVGRIKRLDALNARVTDLEAATGAAKGQDDDH